MKANRLWFILWVCLLGAGLAGFLLFNHHRRPPVIALTEPLPPDLRPAESVGAGAARPAVRRDPVKPTPVRPTTAPKLASLASALASPGSPGNAANPDENRVWARAYPSEALAWALQAAAGPQRDAVMETVCPQVAATNAAAAVALVERAGSSCSNLLANMVQLWAEQDGAAAYAWAMNRPAGEERDCLFGRLAFVEAKTRPEEAARLIVEQMSSGAAQVEAAISVMHQWALRDAPAALAWAQLFPEGTLRDRAIGEVQNIMNMNAAAESQPTL